MCVLFAVCVCVCVLQFQSEVLKLGPSFMLLCPSAIPLRHFLHREASSLGIKLDNYFYQYVDINTEFSRGFPENRKPDTLEEICVCIPPLSLTLLVSNQSGASLIIPI